MTSVCFNTPHLVACGWRPAPWVFRHPSVSGSPPVCGMYEFIRAPVGVRSCEMSSCVNASTFSTLQLEVRKHLPGASVSDGVSQLFSAL